MVVMLIDAVFQSPVASVWWPWDRSGGLVDYEEIAALAEPPNMADSGGLDGYFKSQVKEGFIWVNFVSFDRSL